MVQGKAGHLPPAVPMPTAPPCETVTTGQWCTATGRRRRLMRKSRCRVPPQPYQPGGPSFSETSRPAPHKIWFVVPALLVGGDLTNGLQFLARLFSTHSPCWRPVSPIQLGPALGTWARADGTDGVLPASTCATAPCPGPARQVAAPWPGPRCVTASSRWHRMLQGDARSIGNGGRRIPQTIAGPDNAVVATQPEWFGQGLEYPPQPWQPDVDSSEAVKLA